MAHRLSLAIGFLPTGAPEVLYCGADASASLAAVEVASASGKYAEAAHYRNPQADKVRRSEVTAPAAEPVKADKPKADKGKGNTAPTP